MADNLSNKGGRPPKFSTVKELEASIEKYFTEKCQPEYLKDCKGEYVLYKGNVVILNLNAPTISGLALYLGFADRRSLYDYKEREEFSHTIKRTITQIEEFAERQLLEKDKPVGAMFWLKNHGWSDKIEQEHSGKDGKPLTLTILGYTPEKR